MRKQQNPKVLISLKREKKNALLFRSRMFVISLFIHDLSVTFIGVMTLYSGGLEMMPASVFILYILSVVKKACVLLLLNAVC